MKIGDEQKLPTPEKEDPEDNPEQEIKKSKGIKMKEILIRLSEDDKYTERISFDEYLRLTRALKFPALLIDIFKYLGAKKYVSYVLEPEANQNVVKTVDSDASAALTKRGAAIKLSHAKEESEINKWRQVIGVSKVDDFIKAFRKISANPAHSEVEMIVTLDSIRGNFKAIFGVQNDFFATALYYYLSNGYHQKEIKLPDFISKFLGFNTLLQKDLYTFLISFLDANRDGQVTLIDLIYFYTHMQKNTQFGEEIANAIELFISKLVFNIRGSRPRVITSTHFRLFFPELSWVVTEFLIKLFEKEKTIEMVNINTVNDVTSVFAVDPEKSDAKNPKLFYHLFDDKYKKDSYYLA